jgi:predicted exporter
VPLMLDLHAALAAGADLATALVQARRALRSHDPVAVATALSFIALGGI